MSPLKNIIIQKESDENVRQWHLNREQSIALISVTAILIGSFVFLSADYLSTYIYEKRLNEFKANYANVSKNLEILKERLAQIDEDLEIIEEKDSAIRSYAGMPSIDKDIQKLGIGGLSLIHI